MPFALWKNNALRLAVSEVERRHYEQRQRQRRKPSKPRTQVSGVGSDASRHLDAFYGAALIRIHHSARLESISVSPRSLAFGAYLLRDPRPLVHYNYSSMIPPPAKPRSRLRFCAMSNLPLAVAMRSSRIEICASVSAGNFVAS